MQAHFQIQHRKKAADLTSENLCLYKHTCKQLCVCLFFFSEYAAAVAREEELILEKKRKAQLREVTHDSLKCVWYDSFICVTCLIHVCGVTHSYV